MACKSRRPLPLSLRQALQAFGLWLRPRPDLRRLWRVPGAALSGLGLMARGFAFRSFHYVRGFAWLGVNGT